MQLESSYDDRLSLQMRSFKDKIAQVNGNILEYSHNKERIIELKSQPKLEELRLRKNVIKELNPLILGAIGENLVMKELKKLPNDHILINDFDLQFSKAIYYRKEDSLYTEHSN